MRIFLSYASEDRVTAEEVSLALEAQGHEVFFDRADLEAGGDFHTVIRNTLRKTDLLIFLISPASVAPGAYSLTELRLARERWPHPRRRVLPVIVEPVPMEQIPVYLRGVTIMEPEGSIAAEVAASVSRRPHRLRPASAAAGAVGLLALGVAAVATSDVLRRDNSEPEPEPVWSASMSQFVTRYVYPPDIIETLEYSLDHTQPFAAGDTMVVRLHRVAFGELGDSLALAVAVRLRNTTPDPILLDLDHRFFELADDQGRGAELVYFCCRSRGATLGPGEEREMQLLFRAPDDWTGKETGARRIYFRISGLMPLARAVWAFPPLVTAA